MEIKRYPAGVIVHQVTDEERLTDNIYCERSYCTPDSRWFIYQRKVSDEGPVAWQFTAEFVACEFGTWRTHELGIGYSYPEVGARGGLFYARKGRDVERELVRTDIETGEERVIPVDGGIRPYTGMTVSADERWLAYGVALGFDPQCFGVEFVDLATGRKRIICEDPSISNPHTQIDPGDSQRVLVQHNRGCKFAPDGSVVTWLGEEGCTLFVVDARDGRRTPLAVGPPHTKTCTGHQQWIAATGEALLTIHPDDQRLGGNLLVAKPGGAARSICPGARFAHVHASVCGRLFCCDDLERGEIVVGSIRTGRKVVVAMFRPGAPGTYSRFGQSIDPHPYLSPDARRLVFNSCRTGWPEIHVAEIPQHILDDLLA